LVVSVVSARTLIPSPSGAGRPPHRVVHPAGPRAPSPAGRRVSQEGRAGRVLVTVSAGAVIGVVEVVLAISFAALVFGGYLEDTLAAGIGIYLLRTPDTPAVTASA